MSKVVDGDNRLVNALHWISEDTSKTGGETYVIQLSEGNVSGVNIVYVGNIQTLLNGNNHDEMNNFEFRRLQRCSGWEDVEYYILTVVYKPNKNE